MKITPDLKITPGMERENGTYFLIILLLRLKLDVDYMGWWEIEDFYIRMRELGVI